MAAVESRITLTFEVERTVPSSGTVDAIARDTLRQLANSVNSAAHLVSVEIVPTEHPEPEVAEPEPEAAVAAAPNVLVEDEDRRTGGARVADFFLGR